MALGLDFRPRLGTSFGRPLRDRGLSFRLALLFVPVGICLAVTGIWLGHHVAANSLREAVSLLPQAEARLQASRVEEVFSGVRNGLFRIANLGNPTARQVRENLDDAFRESLPYVAEIGVAYENSPSFLLLRDNGEVWEVPADEALAGPYAGLQQQASVSLTPGRAMLLPAVVVHYPSGKPAPKPVRKALIRMALPLKDTAGVLIVGVDLFALYKTLYGAGDTSSPLQALARKEDRRLSYFFDLRGWILFEAGGQDFFPSSVRGGYSGDFARPGYDAAFRPWAVHEDYWRMVIDIREDKSGGSETSAAHYSQDYSGYPAFLCWAPVRFAPAEGQPAVPVAGVAFFETSSLLLSIFLRGANAFIIFLPTALVILAGVVVWAGRRISRPLRVVALRLEDMGAGGDLIALHVSPTCEEHQMLQAAANSVVTRAMVLQSDLERINKAMHSATANLPVDLQQTALRPKVTEEFGLVGSGRLMREVREQVRKAAKAGTDVLIFGETGTGKELVAEAIHNAGPRSGGPFVSINCGALDENLLMDSLFGHIKGAFTEAKTDRKGAFLAADGGTLLLDEIANASLKVQQTLLRALAVRRIRPLGTDREIPFNTRVVAATNVDLRDCVKEGTFREDLFYRLAIITIETPPLRERKEDLPELAAYCLHEAAQSMNRTEMRLSRGALELMAAHDWPGNVREFKNCLTRAVAFAEGDTLLRRHITLEQETPDFAPGGAEKARVGAVGKAEDEAAFIPPPADVDRERLNERQARVLAALNGRGGFSRAEYEAAAGGGVSSRTAQNDLRELVELGILKKTGAGPGTRYILQGPR